MGLCLKYEIDSAQPQIKRCIMLEIPFTFLSQSLIFVRKKCQNCRLLTDYECHFLQIKTFYFNFFGQINVNLVLKSVENELIKIKNLQFFTIYRLKLMTMLKTYFC